MQATGKSIFIAMFFCAVSGASTIAGGNFAAGNAEHITQDTGGESWLEKEETRPPQRLVCMI